MKTSEGSRTSQTSPIAPKAPQNLSKEARAWWVRITSSWKMDDSGLLILAGTLEALDRMRQAQRMIKKDGIVVVDRFGQAKAHPATLIERDSRTAVARGLKALNLDIEGITDAT